MNRLNSQTSMSTKPVLTEKSVRIVGVEVELRWNYITGVMRELVFSLLYSLSCGLRTRTRLHLEIIALRHQLGSSNGRFPRAPN